MESLLDSHLLEQPSSSQVGTYRIVQIDTVGGRLKREREREQTYIERERERERAHLTVEGVGHVARVVDRRADPAEAVLFL